MASTNCAKLITTLPERLDGEDRADHAHGDERATAWRSHLVSVLQANGVNYLPKSPPITSSGRPWRKPAIAAKMSGEPLPNAIRVTPATFCDKPRLCEITNSAGHRLQATKTFTKVQSCIEANVAQLTSRWQQLRARRTG